MSIEGRGETGRLPQMPLRQTQLRAPEEELEQARKVAAAKGISLSEYLRRALAAQLDRDRGIDVQSAYDRGVEAGREAERKGQEGS